MRKPPLTAAASSHSFLHPPSHLFVAAHHQARTIRSTFAVKKVADDGAHTSNSNRSETLSMMSDTEQLGDISRGWTHMKQNHQQKKSVRRHVAHACACTTGSLHQSRFWVSLKSDKEFGDDCASERILVFKAAGNSYFLERILKYSKNDQMVNV